MKRVVVESPYAGDVEANKQYAKECMLDCLRRGEAPLASHLLYTQILDDSDPEQRELGIQAGFTWNRMAELVCFYVDKGVSHGMDKGMTFVKEKGIPYDIRKLYG